MPTPGPESNPTTCNMGNHMPESTLSLSKRLRIWPLLAIYCCCETEIFIESAKLNLLPHTWLQLPTPPTNFPPLVTTCEPRNNLLYRHQIKCRKCRHLRKIDLQRDFAAGVYQSLWAGYTVSRWYFRPSFVNCCPSNLLSGSTLPPFPACVNRYIVYP